MQTGGDGPEDVLFTVESDTPVYVLAPVHGAWLSNEDGVVAFASAQEAAKVAAERGAEVEERTLGDLLDTGRTGGVGVVWVLTDGRAIVFNTSKE